jgi:hypothetical protein
MEPDQRQEVLDEIERRNQDLEDKRQDLLTALASGWVSKLTPERIRALTPPELAKAHADWQKDRDKAQDAEEEQSIRAAVSSSFSIAPDDPLYDPMTDRVRKERIEKKLSPLDFEQMVFRGHCEQEVEPREGFKVTLRTISTQHGLWLEQVLVEAERFAVQYGRHWFSLLQVACALQAVNGKPIGPSLDTLDSPDHREDFRKALDARMKFIGRLPGLLTDDLIVQYIWFCGRVRKLLAGDLIGKVGN